MTITDRKTVAFDDTVYRSIFHVAVDGLIVSDMESGLVVAANPAACRMLGYAVGQMIGIQLTALIHPDDRPEFKEHIRTIRVGGEIDAWTRDLRRDGTSSYSRWRAGMLDYRGRRSLLWIIRDVSERVEAEQTLRQRLRSLNREQTVLLGLSQQLASALELSPGLVLDELREVIPYDRAAFFRLEGQALVTSATRGTPQLEDAGAIRLPAQSADNLRALLNKNKPIRVADVWSAGPHAALSRSVLGDSAHLLLDGMRSWMWVPLAVSSGILGGLGLAHQKPAFFTMHHADLAGRISKQVVTMMVNAELYRNAQSTAAAQERQRLAQNLHDAINQSLFSAGLIAEVLPRIWETDRELAGQSVEDLRRLLRGATAEMRALLAELRPSTLTEAELGGLLGLLANAFTGRTNVPATVDATGEMRLPADVQVAIYRICQEALNNIAKHAEAGRVEIILCPRGEGIEVRIKDDGKGFEPLLPRPGHFGLTMMRERAEAVGVHLAVTSQPGHGTQVLMRWPVEADKDGE